MLSCRGIRGAITVEDNDREEMLSATTELLQKLVEDNQVKAEDIAYIYFTTTPDLNAEFPAVAARRMGMDHVPLLCGHEMAVPHGLPRCLRILMLVNTERKASEIVHVYLREATSLRADMQQR
ncbi:MAG: chorismate mutase [Dehalococcoidia bacterium]|jgi:chorismate mutase|nr:chorismate mutase [Dehalococcoidia bacterium]MDP6782694.1 chorismate mutase [Dehalococcoidia bacterium]